MSSTSVITHPARTTYHVLRADYIAICENAPDKNCAALLLDLFTYWTDKIIDLDKEWFWRSEKQICTDLFGLFGIVKLRENRKWLEKVGYIQTQTETHEKGIRYLYKLIINKVQTAINSWQANPKSGGGCNESDDINNKSFKDSKHLLTEDTLQGDGKKLPPPAEDVLASDFATQDNIVQVEVETTNLIKTTIPINIEVDPVPDLMASQEILLLVLTRAWMKESTIEKRAGDISWLPDLVKIGLVEQKTAIGEMYRLTDKGYHVKNPPTEPGRKEENDKLVSALSQAYGTVPTGKDYGNYIRVARELLDAGIVKEQDLIKPDTLRTKFKSYMKYIHEIAAEQGGWTPTINSLTTNGRMSEYLAGKPSKSDKPEALDPYSDEGFRAYIPEGQAPAEHGLAPDSPLLAELIAKYGTNKGDKNDD